MFGLRHKRRSLNEQAELSHGLYNSNIFTFEVIDRVVVEAFAFLKKTTSMTSPHSISLGENTSTSRVAILDAFGAHLPAYATKAMG